MEFDSRSEMLTHYSPGGITDYSLQDRVARISDDTQLTLFTAHTLLSAATRKRISAPGFYFLCIRRIFCASALR